MADIREQARESLEGILDKEKLDLLINEVLAFTKKARAEFVCKHCHRTQIQYAEISDSKAVVTAITELLNQTMGRPKEAAISDQEKIHFERVVYLADPPV